MSGSGDTRFPKGSDLIPSDVEAARQFAAEWAAAATGGPAGVGFARKPPVYLKPDDVFKVGVDRIGILKNTLTAEG